MLNELLKAANGKMLAIYKRNPADNSPLSLINGVQFHCTALGYTVNGDNTVEFYDTDNPDMEHFTLDTSLIVGIKKKKKDKYGAIAAWLHIKDDEYLFQFA